MQVALCHLQTTILECRMGFTPLVLHYCNWDGWYPSSSLLEYRHFTLACSSDAWLEKTKRLIKELHNWDGEKWSENEWDVTPAALLNTKPIQGRPGDRNRWDECVKNEWMGRDAGWKGMTSTGSPEDREDDGNSEYCREFSAVKNRMNMWWMRQLQKYGFSNRNTSAITTGKQSRQ